MPAREAHRSVVVCGLHRSGTSVAAHGIASAGGLSLLDDPDWAVFGEHGPLAMLRDTACAAEVRAHDVVKIPRAAEVLPTLVRETPHRYVVSFRDPLDVFASIVEAQYSEHPTVSSMLYYQTVDPDRELTEVDRYLAAYLAYAERALEAVNAGAARLVPYERLVEAPDAVLGRVLRWLEIRRRGAARPVRDRVDPDHNKPRGAKRVQGVGRGRRHLPHAVAAHLESGLRPAYRELMAAYDADGGSAGS